MSAVLIIQYWHIAIKHKLRSDLFIFEVVCAQVRTNHIFSSTQTVYFSNYYCKGVNKVPVNCPKHTNKRRRPGTNALISAGGIRSSENCRPHNPNGLMLISSSTNYRKLNWEGVGCGRYFRKHHITANDRFAHVGQWVACLCWGSSDMTAIVKKE